MYVVTGRHLSMSPSKHRETKELEAQRLGLDVETKRAELALKKEEIDMKKDEMRGMFQEDADRISELMEERERRSQPMDIQRDNAGLLTAVGDRSVERDETGRAVRIV